VPHGETSVVSIFIQNILNEKPSTLNCFPSQPHGNLRDYCFISDVVEANMLISEQDVNGCFNISTGVDTCTLDIYRHIYKTLNGSEFIRNPTIKHSREGDVQRICLDPTRALDVFGWGAKIKTLDGLTKTVNEIKAVL
jgi:UDP-glucose 4-epimerase